MNTKRLAQLFRAVLGAGLAGLLPACSGSKAPDTKRAVAQPAVDGVCQLQSADGGTADAGTEPDSTVPYLSTIGCLNDFNSFAALPLDVTLSGVSSMNIVVDTQDLSQPDRLYYVNSQMYPLHQDFISANVKGGAESASDFNINYYGAESFRRYFLGMITHYKNIKPDVWALEFEPYDNATAAIIETTFNQVKDSNPFFGPALVFHPTSDPQAQISNQLDLSIPVVTTEQIYAQTPYQPVVRATAMGVLRFFTANQVNSGDFIPYDSIVVLDEAPNDLGPVSGIITEQFQAPLSHISMLANTRKIPDMGLTNATSNSTLLQYQNQWVQLTTQADGYQIGPVDPAVGQAWFDSHKPAPATLPAVDLSVQAIVDTADIVPNYIALNNDPNTTQADALVPIQQGYRAYGGKATNYSILSQVDGVPTYRSFSIPIYYYDKFMRDNGFYDMIDGFLNDPNFNDDPTVRQVKLQTLRNAMTHGTFDQDFQNQLKAKLATEYMGLDGNPIEMRFRSSSNSEDLPNFPCAGCYQSYHGNPATWDTVLEAMISVYASAWMFKPFEERSYYGVDQKSFGMGLLVAHHFTGETNSGVAVTADPFDLTGNNTGAYFVDAVYGASYVVEHLPPGVLTDQLLYFYSTPDTPIVYMSHTNVPLPAGQTTCMTDAQVGELGAALTLIQNVFCRGYGHVHLDSTGWCALDVEFKTSYQDFIGNVTSTPHLWIKQARPYANPNSATGN